jgi:DNA polymerase-3 subunit beta
MIQRNMQIPQIEELDQGIILPRKGIHELKKIAENSEENILLGFMDNSVVISKENTIVIMRLVNGDFPDYDRVIPKNNEDIAIINRELLLHVLKRMAILLSEKSKGVKIELKKDKMEISSSNPDIGDAHEEMEIVYSGPEMTIGLNARYMIDILNALECENIKLAVKDNMSPGLITPEGDDGFISVIMPMRL